MALVVTLALIVLVTIATMAFFVRATANRTIESSRANQILVSQLEQTANDYLVSSFLQEMTNNAQMQEVGGIRLFQVTNSIGMVPFRSLAQATMTNDTNFVNLVRQSVPGADPSASGESTVTPSRNGRFISQDRWNAPRLNFGNGFTDTNQLPNWIYITINGTTTNTASTDVVGRFAYNVYETSGLLDANVAGHPSSVNGQNIERIHAALASAALEKIGVPAHQVQQLMAFRSPGATTGDAFTSMVLESAKLGSLRSRVNGVDNNFFSSRQDLIRYATTQSPGLAGALPFLTHTSRFSSAPSWGPSTPVGSSIDYAAVANSANSANRYLPNVRVQGSFTRRDGSAAQAGESLLNQRFPLSRLSWIGNDGVIAPGTAESVQSNFGLQWDTVNRVWEYVGHSGNAVQTSIKTLHQVASENREPNFFELLKAGILSGSVGRAADQKTLAGVGAQTLEADQDLQIIRIGANLIDQADNDNFPTTIRFAGVNQFGVEDLPYLQNMIASLRWRYRNNGTYNSSGMNFSSPVAISLEGLALVWVPKLFQVHQSVNTPAESPTRIRVRISSGVLTSINFIPLNISFQDNTHTGLNVSSPINLGVLPVTSIEIPAANFTNFRATPKVIEEVEVLNESSAIHRQLTLPFWNTNVSGGDRACGFVPWQISASSNHTVTGTGSGQRQIFPRVRAEGVMFTLEFFDGSVWRPYDALAGNPGLSDLTGISTAAPTNEWDQGGLNFGSGTGTQPYGNSIANMHAVYKIDLRTTRWAASHGWEDGRNIGLLESLNRGFRGQKPFAASLLIAPQNPTNPGLWPEGALSANNNQVPGADGVWRPNDSYHGEGGNLYRNLADTVRRPVILQRPFRSVAEMGYAFRDTPWQTLNFFHERSGDSGLLDLFSVDEEPPIVAGKINPNRAPAPVITALLATSFTDPVSGQFVSNPEIAASNFVQYRSAIPGGAMSNRAGLVGFVSSSNNTESSSLKIRREAPVRGLTDVAETSTWNLFADVVAQTGRVEPATGVFSVEGEGRVWSFFALDRIRGKVLFSSQERVSQ